LRIGFAQQESNSGMDMEFNVAQLMKDGVGGTRSYEFGAPELLLSEPIEGDPAPLIARDVHGKIKFTALRGQLRAVGHVEATAGVICSRCLEPFSQRVETTIDELFRQTIDVTSGYAVKAEPGEEPDLDTFTIDQNHIVDLTEAVRQNLLLALPMRPLHSEDCKGLCPTCGTNWNLADCDCPTEEQDPRFAALAQLLEGAGGAE
jgi:uncharacterized protein